MIEAPFAFACVHVVGVRRTSCVRACIILVYIIIVSYMTNMLCMMWVHASESADASKMHTMLFVHFPNASPSASEKHCLKKHVAVIITSRGAADRERSLSPTVVGRSRLPAATVRVHSGVIVVSSWATGTTARARSWDTRRTRTMNTIFTWSLITNNTGLPLYRTGSATG